MSFYTCDAPRFNLLTPVVCTNIERSETRHPLQNHPELNLTAKDRKAFNHHCSVEEFMMMTFLYEVVFLNFVEGFAHYRCTGWKAKPTLGKRKRLLLDKYPTCLEYSLENPCWYRFHFHTYISRNITIHLFSTSLIVNILKLSCQHLLFFILYSCLFPQSLNKTTIILHILIRLRVSIFFEYFIPGTNEENDSISPFQ